MVHLGFVRLFAFCLFIFVLFCFFFVCAFFLLALKIDLLFPLVIGGLKGGGLGPGERTGEAQRVAPASGESARAALIGNSNPSGGRPAQNGHD